MSANEKSRAQRLEEFLLDYLPFGTPQEEHDLIVAVVEAARAHIARRLDDDQPPIVPD